MAEQNPQAPSFHTAVFTSSDPLRDPSRSTPNLNRPPFPFETQPSAAPTGSSSHTSQGETWVDFLRESTQENSSPASHDRYHTDRKRRLTAEEAPLRRPSQPTRSSTMSVEASSSSSAQAIQGSGVPSSALPGSSISNAIDLTGSDPRSRPSASSANPGIRPQGINMESSTGRRQSEFVLPRWQPDAETSYCPVCGNQFTFWYRKHHCRKCGRVVCSECSPHRITIPRQFIVHPPGAPNDAQTPTVDLTDDSYLSDSHAMWGGEEVRVCNPCVPDPNLSPPPYHLSTHSASHIWPFPTLQDNGQQRSIPGSLQISGSLDSSRPSRGHRSTQSDTHLITSAQSRHAQNPFQNPNLNFQHPTSVRDLWPPTNVPHPGQFPPRTSSSSASRPANLPGHRSRLSFAPPTSADFRMSKALPAAPRPQIAEEDECPVCGNELPPKGPNGDTAARETHVEECVRDHSYSTTTSTSAPTQTGLSLSSPSHATVGPSMLPGTSASSEAHSMASGFRQRRMTGGRMLVYKATEKDCMGEDGLANECVICLEDFEVGDEMGRLECLCKFHRKCIRDWWERKGAGTCPTHQLHE